MKPIPKGRGLVILVIVIFAVIVPSIFAIDWFDKSYPDYTLEQAIEMAIPKAVSKEPEPPPPEPEPPEKEKFCFLWWCW